jgi:hypothetical protein
VCLLGLLNCALDVGVFSKLPGDPMILPRVTTPGTPVNGLLGSITQEFIGLIPANFN